jgi:hypothetical protein
MVIAALERYAGEGAAPLDPVTPAGTAEIFFGKAVAA